MVDRILSELHQERIVAIAQQIIAIPSVTNAEHAMSDYTAQFLHNLGFSVTRLAVAESGDTIVATYGSGDQAVMLNFHLDTFDVFVGWESDPFIPVISGDRMYGLGAHDMKGGAACVLAIAEALVTSGVQLPGRVIISATSDEENWSRGAHVMLASNLLHGCVAALVPEPSNAGTLTIGQRGRHVFHVQFWEKPCMPPLAVASMLQQMRRDLLRPSKNLVQLIWDGATNLDSLGHVMSSVSRVAVL